MNDSLIPDSTTEDVSTKILALPFDAPDWAHVLNSNLGVVAEQISIVRQTHQRILDVVEEVRPEVSGIIAGLQKNPMFRMLTGGK